MYLTGTRGVIDRHARQTRGFRRFNADLGGECGHLLINKEILSKSPFGRTTQSVVAFHRQELAAQGAVSTFSIFFFKKTAGQAHTVQVPSCQCVRLPRLLLGQPSGPNNAAQPSSRPARLYEKRGRGAASVVKSLQEPRIVVCRKHNPSPSMAELQSWQAPDRRETSG
jgi:hypothetical protein